jgi:hypothetical protein
MIVLGFDHPDFHGQILTELERLREHDTVRVIDALAVYKDAAGELEVAHISNIPAEEAAEIGSIVAALIGLDIEGDSAPAGEEIDDDDGLEEDEWDVLGDIPNDSAAAIVLLEHRWAIPLREAVVSAGGYRVADGFISPLDLAAAGLVSAEHARELHAVERRSATR